MLHGDGMTIRQQWTVVLVIALALGGGLFAATRYLGDELFLVSVGSPAPNFQALTLGTPARQKTLEDYRGDVVLLNIWATWCGPCRVEMPSIQALHEEFAPRGLKVVAVSIDNRGKDREIQKFAKEYGLTFEILHDAEGRIRRAYQASGVPETFVIGRDGIIRKKEIGAARWDSPANRSLVRQLLAEPTR